MKAIENSRVTRHNKRVLDQLQSQFDSVPRAPQTPMTIEDAGTDIQVAKENLVCRSFVNVLLL